VKEGKKFGELAEQMFCIEVLKRGGVPCKPIGDSQPYDWLVVSGGKIHKVQVKSSWMTVLNRVGSRSTSRCRVCVSHRTSKKAIYKKHDIDHMAIWLEPFGSWMIMPIAKLGSKKTMQVRRADCESPSWSLLGL
jgi:hypothetical protein